MNVLDSSAWLEYLADGPNADAFAPVLTKLAELLVPTVSIYEVFKRVLMQRSELDALEAVALMVQGEVIDPTTPIALDAARISAAEKLSRADSIMLATARAWGATLYTQDAHFEGKPGVQFVPKT